MNENDATKRLNWSPEDKIMLQQLIREKVNVLENKNTDSNTNHRKMKAWKEIEESFNQVAFTKRNVTQLKCQWNIIKISAKKESSQRKRALFQTGGGPPPQEEALSSDDIRSWMPNEFVVEFNSFDSDKPLQDTANTSTSEPLPLDVGCAYTMPASEESTVDIVELTINDESNNAETEQNEIGKKLTKRVQSKKSDDKKAPATLIAENEIKCRLELHELQMEYERKKGRNFDMEYEYLQKKIKLLKE